MLCSPYVVLGITKGTTATTFSPGKQVTRASPQPSRPGFTPSSNKPETHPPSPSPDAPHHTATMPRTLGSERGTTRCEP